MERKDNIRKALNSFLPLPGPPEKTPVVNAAAAGRPDAPPPMPSFQLVLSESQQATLRDLQNALRRHGINAEVEDIGHGILEALVARPSLCRGLFAAYLLDV